MGDVEAGAQVRRGWSRGMGRTERSKGDIGGENSWLGKAVRIDLNIFDCKTFSFTTQ